MASTKRPPVITIMGHVDHGKTTLLDFIRSSNVTDKEAGGITQHIGAYQIEFKNNKLTFIDTPGHAAFHKMRERGAQITDIVVLVIAANDGVKPQTIESIRHIKQSNVSLIVAVNKIDLKDADITTAKSQLVEHDILVQGFGGSVDAIELSAKTGKGVDKLLETIVTTADLLELKADPQAPLEAVVIESFKDKGRGPVASVIVQQGTLRVRQDVVSEDIVGRVRQLTNEKSERLKEVGPGSPAELVGLKDVPSVGAVVNDANHLPLPKAKEEEAETTQEKEVPQIKEEETPDDPFADIDFEAAFHGEKPKLTLMIRADVKGTLEAIMANLDEDSVQLISSGVGQVTESDVELAQTSGALIIAFHTSVDKRAEILAKRVGVKVKQYDIIYELIEELQKQMLKIMEPTIDEVTTGEAEILQIFEMKGERIAGVRVKTGLIKKNDLFHLKREEEIISNPVVKNMMHGKEEVAQTKAKNECGLTFKNKKLDFQVGDILVAYKKEED